MSGLAEFSEMLRRACGSFCDLSDMQVEACWRHYELMVKWNRTINLTRVTGFAEAVERHYGESLFLASHLPSACGVVADIGSGAGFPGFPVAVLGRASRVILVESDLRKASFLRETRDLWTGLEVRAERAEGMHEGVDWVISRAVRPKDVVRVAERLGASVALLVSEDDAAQLAGGRTIPVPFARGGVLYLRST